MYKCILVTRQHFGIYLVALIYTASLFWLSPVVNIDYSQSLRDLETKVYLRKSVYIITVRLSNALLRESIECGFI